MKIVLGLVLGCLVAFFPPSAMARDLCLTETIPGPGGGSSFQVVFKAFTIPAKGACKPVIAIVPAVSGLVESGAGCTTTDGKSLLFTLFSGFGESLGNVQGSITLSSGSGSISGLTLSSGGGSAAFSTGTMTIETCPKKPTPITDSGTAD